MIVGGGCDDRSLASDIERFFKLSHWGLLGGGAYSQDPTFAFAATLVTPCSAPARRAVHRRSRRTDHARRPPTNRTFGRGPGALRSYLSRGSHCSGACRVAKRPRRADHRPTLDVVRGRAALLQL